jgi:ammonium transporter Rh
MFLWIYWPSFNGAMTGSSEAFSRVVVNTIMSLTGSCIVSFLFSFVLRGEKKFCMIDIQNATLAGGVAMGAAADLPLGIASSLAIGMIAGGVSVLGYTRLQSKLEYYFQIYDTCGVLNLHGLPGVIGGK